MKKKSLLLTTCLTLLILLSGCTSKNKNDLEQLTVMLDWYPNAVHTALYVAQEKGYFKEEGLDIKIEMPADTNDPLKLAATGKVDLAISYQSQLLQSRSENIPVISVGAFVRHSLDGIMYKKDKGITSPKDLEGKNVGYASTSISEAIVSSMVEHDGGSSDSVKLTDVGWDLMPSLATDNVDAIVGAYINHELVLLNKEGYDVDILPLTEYGVPDQYELIFVTGEKTFDKKEDSLKKFWRALTKAQNDVVSHPDKSLETLFNHENNEFPLDMEVEKESLNVLLPLMQDESIPFGYQEDDVWNAVSNWLYEEKVIKQKLDPKSAYRNLIEK